MRRGLLIVVGVLGFVGCGDDGPAATSFTTAPPVTTMPPATGMTEGETTAPTSGEPEETGGSGDADSSSGGPIGSDPTEVPMTSTTLTTDSTSEESSGSSGAPEPFCGDGVVDDGEACDDGMDNGAGKACLADCTANVCGDGDVGPGEGCDDGNAAGGDGCSATCQSEGCGNSMVEPMEGCDDGMNGDQDDGCTDMCQVPKCGDGFTQASLMETCDDGANNSNTGPCTASCKLAVCGDGLVLMGTEMCDAGMANSNTGMCTTACKTAVCGDGLVYAGVEECDDSNANNGDGCSAACKKETKCGNGVIDPGERCDTALPAPYVGVGCKPQTCVFDFSTVPQLYCNGSCSWAGADSCDQPDADIFCKLRTGNPNSTALGFQLTSAQATNGFACPGLNNNLGPMPEFGVNLNVWYQPGSVLGNHGGGTVIVNPNCSNP